MKGAFKLWSELPPWAKGVTGVAAAAGLFFVGSKAYGAIKSATDKGKYNSSVKDANAELKNTVNSGVYPSFPDSQYQAWCNEIVKQFSGCDYSVGTGSWIMTDSAKLLNNICGKLKNNADFLKLQTAFGVRTYPDCLFGTVTGDLAACVIDELSSGEISGINSTLSGKGITYKF